MSTYHKTMRDFDEQIKPIIPGDYRMIRPAVRDLFSHRLFIGIIRYEHFPPICRASQLIQVKSDEIVEEMAINLSAKDKEFGA